jgi:hypothetical protein
VFDLWVDVWRKKHARGEMIVIRYADDIVLGFQWETDADRFRKSLGERLGKFGLELHPEKTRRIEFGRYAEQNRKRRGEGKPETFDFLGFTHISGKNGNGAYAVRRMTIRKRMRKKLQEIKQQLRIRMHDPVPQTGAWLRSVVQGYFNYYAVTETSTVWGYSGSACIATGDKRSSAVFKDTGTPGSVVSNSPHNGFLNLVCSIPIPLTASPPLIRDRSRMR